jgi:predicted site-specific integrase-resolvase
MTLRGWVKIKDAATYAGVSPRTFRNWLKQGLRHARVGGSGALLIKLDWIDEFLENHEVPKDDYIDRIVDSVMKDFTQRRR